MENWRIVFRDGIIPNISRAGLLSLRDALLRDDARILQGTSTSPAPLDALGECEVTGACAIGFCGWQAEGRSTVAEVLDYFHRVCDAADTLLGEQAACRYFLTWFDAADRPVMRAELLGEINAALSKRVPSAA